MVIAEELIALYESPREAPPFTDAHPDLTPQAGYEAAHALHAHRLARGWRAVGRKIGFTNRTIWPRYGVYEPIWGRVYDRTAIYAERDRAALPLSGLLNPRIEPEICFGLRGAPRAADPTALLDALDWVAHTFEIVQSPFRDWKFRLPDCTAANGLHGRLVIGSRVPVRDLPQLARALPEVAVELRRDGGPIDRGVGANVLDSPLLALGHLVRLLAGRSGDALAAGELISTGTITDAHPVKPGETWSTELRGLPLPGLTVEFT